MSEQKARIIKKEIERVTKKIGWKNKEVIYLVHEMTRVGVRKAIKEKHREKIGEIQNDIDDLLIHIQNLKELLLSIREE